ncbi:MAG: MBL fold metallo-hydrolase, partial [Planctomycetota bacterium]
MTIGLTWLSHASWLIEIGGQRILLDPFLTDNPAATLRPDELVDISHILVSHGHFDHVTDVELIAKANQSTIVTNFEIANWYGEKGFG